MVVPVLIVLALFALAARQDLLTRLISDALSAGIAALMLAIRLDAGWRAVAESLGTGFGVFVLLFFAHSRGAIGGGDVKLLTALSIGLPPLGTFHFLVATIMAGGLIGLTYLALGRLRLSPGSRRNRAIRRILAVECWRARRFRAVPYAVAIAAGAFMVLLPPVLPALAPLGNITK